MHPKQLCKIGEDAQDGNIQKECLKITVEEVEGYLGTIEKYEQESITGALSVCQARANKCELASVSTIPVWGVSDNTGIIMFVGYKTFVYIRAVTEE